MFITRAKQLWFISIAILLFFASNAAHALLAGDIRVDSYLKQPFKAVVPILDAQSTDIYSLKVKLASNNSYKQAGVERNKALEKLRFSVDREAGAIYVFSLTPINEPLLILLLDVSWSKGALVREYTIFLDSEEYQPEIEPIKSPTLGDDTTVNRVEEINVDFDDYQQQIAQPEYSVPSVYGPVGAGQSLSSIATKLVTGTQYSTTQMMLALYQANSGAFYKKNVNALKQGVSLNVPALSELEKYNASVALALISEHLQKWQNGQQSVASQSILQAVTQEIELQRNEASGQTSNSSQTNQTSTNNNIQLVDVARNTPRLELVPEGSSDSGALSDEETDMVANDGTAELATAIENASDNNSNTTVNSRSNDNAVTTSPITIESSNKKQLIASLESENFVLRQQVDDANSVITELRDLHTQNSEKLAALTVQLTEMQQERHQQESAAQQSSLLLALLIIAIILIIALLGALLFLLNKSRKDQQLIKQTTLKNAAPVAGMAVVAEGEDDDAELSISEPIHMSPGLGNDTSTAATVVPVIDTSKPGNDLSGSDPLNFDLEELGLLGGGKPSKESAEILANAEAEKALEASQQDIILNPSDFEPIDIDAFLAENAVNEISETAEDNAALDSDQLISGEDDMQTNLDMAKAYADMGLEIEAREVLNKVIQSNDPELVEEAEQLLAKL